MQKQRNAAMDAARGFTVLIMPAVHSVLMYSEESVRKGRLGKILGFLAEGPGAQLFMFLMGASVVFGRKKQTGEILFRSLKLFISGYLLNALRLLPMYRNKLPPDFFNDYNINDDADGRRTLILSGDILHSAALAYPVCALLYRKKYYPVYSIFLGLLICFLSPFVWRINTKNRVLQLPLNLLTGTPPHAFFPIFPWITYALTGLAVGDFLKKAEPKKLYPGLLLTGCCLLIAGKKLSETEPDHLKTNFYRPRPSGILYHTGIVFLWLYLCHLSTRTIKRTHFFRLLTFLSKHITTVYFIQWILVFWQMPFWGYRKLNHKRTLLSITVNTVSTFAFTYLIDKLTAEIKQIKSLRDNHTC